MKKIVSIATLLLIFPISSYAVCLTASFDGFCYTSTGVPIGGCQVWIKQQYPPIQYYTSSLFFGYWGLKLEGNRSYSVNITTPDNCHKNFPTQHYGCNTQFYDEFYEPRYKIVGNEKRWRAGNYPSTTMDNYVNTIGWNCDFTSQEGDMVIE